MDINKFTQKSQEALSEAQSIAIQHHHMEVDVEHLFSALLHQSEGLVPRLLNRMDAPLDTIQHKLVEELQRRPRVSGPGAEHGRVYVTNKLNQILLQAEEEANRLKDEYVSVEHIILAILTEKTSTPSARILKETGITGTLSSRHSPLCVATSVSPAPHRKALTKPSNASAATRLRSGARQTGPGHRS